jgi:hypothetical protein
MGDEKIRRMKYVGEYMETNNGELLIPPEARARGWTFIGNGYERLVELPWLDGQQLPLYLDSGRLHFDYTDKCGTLLVNLAPAEVERLARAVLALLERDAERKGTVEAYQNLYGDKPPNDPDAKWQEALARLEPRMAFPTTTYDAKKPYDPAGLIDINCVFRHNGAEWKDCFAFVRDGKLLYLGDVWPTNPGGGDAPSREDDLFYRHGLKRSGRNYVDFGADAPTRQGTANGFDQ